MKSRGNHIQPAHVLGVWKIYPDLSCLSNDKGEELYLEPRLMKLLSVLLQQKNEILKREELIHQVWEETLVNEESLTKAIFDLRKFMKMHFPTSAKILTIRKIGYKLILMEAMPEKSRLHRLTGKLLRAALYLFLAFAIFVILIRAINY